MSQFAIYKYEFVPTGTRGLSHQGTDGASLLNQAHEQLSRSLTTEDSSFTSRKNRANRWFILTRCCAPAKG